MSREIFAVVRHLEQAREEMNYIQVEDVKTILKIQSIKHLIEDVKSQLFDLNESMK